MDRRKFLIGATGAAAVVAGCSDENGDDDGTASDDGTADENGNETDDETGADDGDDDTDTGNETDDEAGNESDDDAGNETDDEDDEFDGEEADEDEFDGEEADDESDDEDDDSDADDEDEAEDEDDDADDGEDELDPDDYENEIVNDSPLEVADFEVGDGCELTARVTRPDGETAQLQYDFVVYYGDDVLAESRNNDYELDGDDASHELTAVLSDCSEATHFGFELHGYEPIERVDGDEIDGYVSMEGGTDNVFSVQSHAFDGQNCQVELEVYNETPDEITGFVWVGIRGDRDEQEESTEIDLEGGATETLTFGAQDCGNVRTYSIRGDVLEQ
ncbi:hypothetical protein [Natronococcus occultus]|uniref:Uncharacterized protein n=1 Tax=Natronococcus occultus SP4 TaxID=694430 RepID=L0K3L4_9EURY|nr:hypothetical protein [Natronococcus occultus]AGB38698.1 hypothetical protein Natoc_2943 [Natronococcus occultus SP4]